MEKVEWMTKLIKRFNYTKSWFKNEKKNANLYEVFETLGLESEKVKEMESIFQYYICRSLTIGKNLYSQPIKQYEV